jgi:hypothetical protein
MFVFRSAYTGRRSRTAGLTGPGCVSIPISATGFSTGGSFSVHYEEKAVLSRKMSSTGTEKIRGKGVAVVTTT